jgi:acetate kinase
MKVLVINCGSSSLKYQLIDSDSEQVLAVGICERIGQEVSHLKHTPEGQSKIVIETTEMKNHEVAVQMVLHALTDEKHGVIKSLDEISAIGHRVVHGGEKFACSTIINDEVIAALEECCELAPLHNPANLIGIHACEKLMPGKPQVGVFDTAFHQTMPPKAYLYGIPHEYYKKYKIRKYGFHGTSHSFVSKETAKFCGLDINNSKIIVCHLGNGSSISAVLNGKSIDTSMGFTPLAGLVMGTRCGDIDPSIIEFMAKKEGKSLDQVMNVLNKESGLQGMSEVSSDFRDLNDAVDEGNELATIAFQVFCYNVAKYIGGYVAAMNGVDAIAFTAGVGENDWRVREWVCEYLGYLGVKIDLELNNTKSKLLMLTTPECKTKVCIVPTNEELAIARETVELLK